MNYLDKNKEVADPGPTFIDKTFDENKLPKGAVIFMEGFENDTSEKDIKEALFEKFDVKDEAFALIEKGETCGYVRFHKENAAIELVAKMNEKLKIKGAEIDFRVLEGNEETAYLSHTLIVLKMSKNKKRGFGEAFGLGEHDENRAKMKGKNRA